MYQPLRILLNTIRISVTPLETKVTSTHRAIANCKATVIGKTMVAKTATASEPTIATRGTGRIIAKVLDSFTHLLGGSTGCKELACGVDATKELVLTKRLAISDHNLARILAVGASTVENHSLTRGILSLDFDSLESTSRGVKKVLDRLEVNIDIGLGFGLGCSGPLGQGINPGHLLVAELSLAVEIGNQGAGKSGIALAQLVNDSGQCIHSRLLGGINLHGLTGLVCKHLVAPFCLLCFYYALARTKGQPFFGLKTTFFQDFCGFFATKINDLVHPLSH
jgi:hypothetical protein